MQHTDTMVFLDAPQKFELGCWYISALGHLHGVSTGGQDEPNDLEVARQLMLTCYEMYRQIPTGLSPEIVFFTQHDRGDDYPKLHHMDVGGGEFMAKQQVSPYVVPCLVPSCITLLVPPHSLFPPP